MSPERTMQAVSSLRDSRPFYWLTQGSGRWRGLHPGLCSAAPSALERAPVLPMPRRFVEFVADPESGIWN